MIWDTMAIAGIDRDFIDVIKVFYRDNRHILKLRGSEFGGVVVQSGVRQGCPLSGLIFAICVDILLARISKVLREDEAVGAFADDIAVVLNNFWVAAPVLQPIFQEFHRISALQLNPRKTVMVPLWPYKGEGSIRKLIREFCPGWVDFDIAPCGKYLGYVIGPGAGQDRWSKPLAKFESRVNFWAGLHLGMSMNIAAFNIYIVPVLEFTAQLFMVDNRVRRTVSWALRRLAAGPGTWVVQIDLENLKIYGFRNEFRTIELTARASKLRVVDTVARDTAKQHDEILSVQSD